MPSARAAPSRPSNCRKLVGGVQAVPAALQVAAQIGVEVGTAAAAGDVQQPVVAVALVVGGEFAVHLEALLAQPLAGPAQFDPGALLLEPQQSGRDRQGLGLDLDVPEQAARGLRQPLERPGQDAPVQRRQQPGGGSVAVLALGAQRRVQQVTTAVGVPFTGDAAHGHQQMGAPGGGRPVLAQALTEQPGEGGRGEHARGALAVGAQPCVGESGRPVAVQQLTDGMQCG